MSQLDQLKIGDTFKFKKCTAEIKFIGEVQGRSGIWYGAELDLPKGKIDGSYKGVKYFDCKFKHGLLISGPDLEDYLKGGEDKNHSVVQDQTQSSSISSRVISGHESMNDEYVGENYHKPNDSVKFTNIPVVSTDNEGANATSDRSISFNSGVTTHSRSSHSKRRRSSTVLDQDKFSKLKARVVEAERDLLGIKKSLNNEKNNLDRLKETHKLEIDRLKAKNEIKKLGDLEIIQTCINDTEKMITEVQLRDAKFSAYVRKILNEIDILKEIESEHVRFQLDLDRISKGYQEKIQKLEQDKSTLESTIDQKNKEVNESEEKIKSLEKRNRELSEEYNAKKPDIQERKLIEEKIDKSQKLLDGSADRRQIIEKNNMEVDSLVNKMELYAQPYFRAAIIVKRVKKKLQLILDYMNRRDSPDSEKERVESALHYCELTLLALSKTNKDDFKAIVEKFSEFERKINEVEVPEINGEILNIIQDIAPITLKDCITHHRIRSEYYKCKDDKVKEGLQKLSEKIKDVIHPSICEPEEIIQDLVNLLNKLINNGSVIDCDSLEKKFNISCLSRPIPIPKNIFSKEINTKGSENSIPELNWKIRDEKEKIKILEGQIALLSRE